MNSACATPRTRPNTAISSRLICRKAPSSALVRGMVKVVKIPPPWATFIGGLPYLLTQGGGGFHVEFIEGHDAIQLLRARQMGDSLHDLSERNFCGKVEGVVQTLTRPVGVAQFFRSEQDYAASLALALAHEVLPFF